MSIDHNSSDGAFFVTDFVADAKRDKEDIMPMDSSLGDAEDGLCLFKCSCDGLWSTASGFQPGTGGV